MTEAAPSAGSPVVVLYRYGALAWFWRGLIGLGGLGGVALLLAAVREAAPVLLLVAAPLLVPGLFFGCVVATWIDREGGTLRVGTLLGWRRRVRIDRLGVPKRRTFAYGHGHRIHAPRLWQPVRGGVPIYLDLLAAIPDRRAFEQVFGALPAAR